MSTPNLDLPLLSESQSGKYRTINTALYLLDSLMGVIKSRASSGPPGGPAVGDGCIVDALTGDWSGFTLGDIAIYYENSAGTASWLNFTPSEGPQVKVDDEDLYVSWNGVEWASVGAGLKPAVDVSGSKTLALSDAFSFQNVTSAATITVPASAAVGFALMVPIVIFRNTSDAVSVVADTGVTFLGAASLSSQNDSIEIMQLSIDTWVVRS